MSVYVKKFVDKGMVISVEARCSGPLSLLLGVSKVGVSSGVKMGCGGGCVFEGLEKGVIGGLAQHSDEVGGVVWLWFPVDLRGGGSNWVTVKDSVTNLGVLTDMVVVHGDGGPLEVGSGGDAGVPSVHGPFAAPAGDAEGFVLVTIGEVKETGRGGWGSRGRVEHCCLEKIRVGDLSDVVVLKEGLGWAADDGLAEVKAGCPGCRGFIVAPCFTVVVDVGVPFGCGVAGGPRPPLFPAEVSERVCCVVRFLDRRLRSAGGVALSWGGGRAGDKHVLRIG